MGNKTAIVVDPKKSLTVIIEPSDYFKGGNATFSNPLEPIWCYISLTVMLASEKKTDVHWCSSRSEMDSDFEIIGWKSDVQELRVKIRKGAFGI